MCQSTAPRALVLVSSTKFVNVMMPTAVTFVARASVGGPAAGLSDAQRRVPAAGVPRGKAASFGQGGGLLGQIRHKLPVSFQYGWRFNLLRGLLFLWLISAPLYISFATLNRDEEEIAENARRYVFMRDEVTDKMHLVDRQAAVQIRQAKIRSDLLAKGEL